MHAGRMVFSQLMDFLPMHAFRACVQRYRGDYRLRTFFCMDQFYCMAFAQLTYRESLRDIVTCLRSFYPKLYHAGIHGTVSRTTLADANETRDWRIYADFAHVLIRKARALYVRDEFGVSLEQAAYVFDSTTIDLCLSLFPWAHFRRHKAAVKLHTLLDLRGSIPCFIHITDGKTADVTTLDDLPLEPGAIYVMDRGYIDFARLYAFTQGLASFVVRAKRNHDYMRQLSRPVNPSTGLRSDQTIALRGPKSSRLYPEPLRRITFFDEISGQRLILLTNNFTLPALTIAQLYKCRWDVETFFKWIKQHLRIKAFYGTSENAVKTQIWIAISVYVLVAIIKKELRIDRSLAEILQVLSLSLFEKEPIYQMLTQTGSQCLEVTHCNQLILFDS
jgi:IS4 transposase